nr:Protein of unknown function (DUF1697) [uncultured bacterium]
MPKYFAFLRAINVGGHVVKMDQLRALFEELGLTNVETFIAGGNVIFDSSSRNASALEKKVAAHLEQALGYPVATFIRSVSELATIVAYQPFPKSSSNEADRLYVGLLGTSPSAVAQKKLLGLSTKLDELHLNGRELYWLCHTAFADSPLSGTLLEKTLGMATTLRNVNTINRLAAKYSQRA